MKLTVSHFLPPRKACREEGQDRWQKELNVLSWGRECSFISALCGLYGHSSSHRMTLLLQERELLFSLQATFRGRTSPQVSQVSSFRGQAVQVWSLSHPQSIRQLSSYQSLSGRCGQNIVTYISQGRTSPQMSLNTKDSEICLLLAPAGLAADHRYVTQTLSSSSKGVLTKTAAKQTSSFSWSYCCCPLPVIATFLARSLTHTHHFHG